MTDSSYVYTLRQSVAREERPAAVLNGDGRVLFRNRAFSEWARGVRRAPDLFRSAAGEGAALILLPVGRGGDLMWLDPLREGVRRLILLRDVSEEEILLLRDVMKNAAAPDLLSEAGGEAPRGSAALRDAGGLADLLEGRRGSDTPLELSAFLGEAAAVCRRAGMDLSFRKKAGEIWTVPDATVLFIGMAQTVRLLCGAAPLFCRVVTEKHRLILTLSFPDSAGVVAALGRIFSGEANDGERPAGLLPLISVLRLCREKDYPFRFDQNGAEGSFSLTLPAGEEMPVCFLGGKRRKRAFVFVKKGRNVAKKPCKKP